MDFMGGWRFGKITARTIYTHFQSLGGIQGVSVATELQGDKRIPLDAGSNAAASGELLLHKIRAVTSPPIALLYKPSDRPLDDH